MNYKYQDKILINDIIERNYYYNFRRNLGKSICLTFYYNHKFNNTNLIPDFPVPQSNPEEIIINLNSLLDFYIKQKFRCDIKINDEFWLTDLEYRDKIINILLEKFKNTEYRPNRISIICNVIHCLENKYEWFVDWIHRFREIDIDLQINFETMLIDIVSTKYLIDRQDFLLKYANSLKIRINPNNFVYFTQVFDSLYTTFKPILYLYEEDNINWTDYKIDEYIEFLNIYIDKIILESNNEIEFLKNLFLNDKLHLISLKDNGVLDNTNARGSCPFYQSLNILLEDLTINLCPKFQYDDQVIGQYLQDEDRDIIEIEPKYLGLISMNVHLKKSSTPHCETCPFVVFCKGFCCKESYKYCLNPIIPLRESCEMKKAKYAFLFLKLKNLNVITKEKLQQIPEINSFYIDYIVNLYNNIIGGIDNA